MPHPFRDGPRTVMATAEATLRVDQVAGLQGRDHTGITVPDTAQAVDFFVNVFECQQVMWFGPFCGAAAAILAWQPLGAKRPAAALAGVQSRSTTLTNRSSRR
jgi:hypothetical protein